jgi:hypothetical protein
LILAWQVSALTNNTKTFLARPVSPSYHIGEGKNQTPESGETTMAFNPNLPQANSPISSAELREQFNALKALIDQRPLILNANLDVVA